MEVFVENFILGLDLGTNSIGWAIIGCDENANPSRLIDANSRIFLSMMEADGKAPKNKQRRDKRLTRRQIRRHKERRDKLLEILVDQHLLPGEFHQPSDWPCLLNQKGKLPNGELKDFLASNPFLLRSEALERNLTRHEFGRVLMHLAKRRGYKSNRGIKYHALFRYIEENKIGIRYAVQGDEEQTETSEYANQHGDKKEAEETGKVWEGIRVLKRQMRSDETIGQFAVRVAHNEKWKIPRRLHTISMDETKIPTKGKSKGQGKTTAYHLHATRELYEDEFSRIWDRQAENFCHLLSQTPAQIKTLREKIEHAIFHQRPPQLQKGKVGMCTIRLKKKRAATALLESQEYLLLQDINNLKYGEVRGRGKRIQMDTHQPLSAGQRQQLLNALSDHKQVNEQNTLTWDRVREILELDASIKFNLEISSNKDKSGEQIKSGKKGITGNRTALAIARVIPEEWKVFTAAQKKSLVNDLLNIHDKVALFNRLRNHYRLPHQRCPWQFSDQQAFELATLELPAGYMKHCFEVITELLRHFRQGMIYSEAKKELEKDPKFKNQSESGQPRHLGEPPDIANPIVQKALYEIRRVVNAIIEKQGCKPKIIRIEMARDMKASKVHRAEMESRNIENRKLNEKAKEAIRDWNQHNPHQTMGLEPANIEKIKLWIEQRAKPDKESTTKIKLWQEQNHRCLYSGRYISFPQIADGEVDIDHIYPRSLSGMNDYLNKVLVFKSENLAKEQKTPWQKWGNSEKYNQIVKRAQEWYGGSDSPLKAKLYKVKNTLDETSFKEEMRKFTESQLNDTRYICVAVKNYLKTLGYTDQEIQVSRGRATADIRRLWELGNILPRAKRDQESKNADKETDDNEIDEAEGDKTKKGKKKDRGDHRHHAIDAIITALTDRRTFADLQRRYRYYELNSSWPNAPLEKPMRADGKPWESLRHDVEQIVMNRVVSFSATRKASGGLHDEQPYGLGHYKEKMPIKKLLKSPDIIRTLPDKTPGKKLEDSNTWIADAFFRQKLLEWLVNWERAKCVKNFPPPLLPDGKPLDTVAVAHRCYVKRAPVVEALKRIENNPGKKTWVANDELRNILRNWLRQPGNSVKSAQVNPPTMPSKNGNGNPIHTVRLASVSTAMVQFKGKPQIFAKASNHHVAIFKRIGTVVERKGIFVDMLEAAKRIRKPPVVRKSPQELLALDPAVNPAEWQFEMFLCNNDMVLWDVDDPDWQQRDKIYLDEKNHHLPIYRLQKMTEGTLTFRHFSVTSTADTDNRGVLRRSPTKLRCKKIRINELGNYNICHD